MFRSDFGVYSCFSPSLTEVNLDLRISCKKGKARRSRAFGGRGEVASFYLRNCESCEEASFHSSADQLCVCGACVAESELKVHEKEGGMQAEVGC